MNTRSTPTTSDSASRRGHAAIGAIISDIESYLPPPNNNTKGYPACRTTFGLLTTFHQRATDSTAPEKEYKELQQLERDLRRRIYGLESKKGVPPQMTYLLDELRDALSTALEEGVTVDFIIEGLEDVLEEKPEAQPAPKESRKMVSEARFVKVWNELKAAKARIEQLNQENNTLTIKVKRLEMARKRGNGDSDSEPSSKRIRL